MANTGEISHKFKFISYQLINFNSVSYLGIILLIICALGFILNRGNKFARVSALWILFSFLILFIFGWGLAENGLILYSLYFGWAYLALFFLFVQRMIKKFSWFKIIMIVICIAMLVLNIIEFSEILKFAVKHY